MHRTQIMLDDAHYAFLTAESRRRGVSMAAVIRGIVAEHMAQRAPEDDPLESIIGIGSSTGDITEPDHDLLIYGIVRR